MEVTAAIITSAASILGILVGVYVTKKLDLSTERKRLANRYRKKVLAKFDDIDQDIMNIIFLLNTIREFSGFDYETNLDVKERARIVVYFGGLHYEEYREAWNRLKKTVYLNFPRTTAYRYFVDLEFFMENIYQDIAVQNTGDALIESLQKVILDKYAPRLMKAVATALLLRDELRSISSARKLRKGNDVEFFEKMARDADRIARRQSRTEK